MLYSHVTLLVSLFGSALKFLVVSSPAPQNFFGYDSSSAPQKIFVYGSSPVPPFFKKIYACGTIICFTFPLCCLTNLLLK